jgi:type I restriction enzyme, S subunit
LKPKIIECKTVHNFFKKPIKIPKNWSYEKYSNIIYEDNKKVVFNDDEQYELITIKRRKKGLVLRGVLKGREILTKNLYDVDEGDFIIARMQIIHGACGLVPKNLSKAKISGSYIRFKAKNSLNIQYLDLFSNTPAFYQQTFVSSVGSNLEKMNFNKDHWLQHSIPLPTRKEQDKIVEIISNLDNLISITKSLIVHTESLKKGMMQKLLTKGINHKKFKKVIGLFGKEIMIPEEWSFVPLIDIVKITMGQSPPSESYNDEEKGLPFYQGTADFGARYPNTTIWCADPKKIAIKNSILFSVRAPVGETNLTNTECCLGRGVSSLYPEKNNLFYCFCLINQNKNSFLVYSQGTTYDAINKDDLVNVKLPFTDNIDEQEKIASILFNIDSQIQLQTQYKEKLERLKKSLLQKLLSGEILVLV